MKPEYAKNEVYSLIASWAEGCGFEIRYKERDNDENLAFTRLEEYEPSYIQMYSNEEIYVKLGKELAGSFDGHDNISAMIGATNTLAHELAHQIFLNVSYKPFEKLFGKGPRGMSDDEDACDAFGNFLFALADRINKNRTE